MEGLSVARGELRFCCSTTSTKGNHDGNRMLFSDALLRKLFENQTGDWEMISSDGKAFKFHKFVLSEQVGRFRTIFAHPGTRECIKKQIVVPPEVGMDGLAVEAFLRFVYYRDTDPINSSLEIACAFIRAGHYYDIPQMVDAADRALRRNGVKEKKLDWLNFEACSELYQYVLLWEESHPFKRSLMKHLNAILMNGEHLEAEDEARKPEDGQDHEEWVDSEEDEEREDRRKMDEID